MFFKFQIAIFVSLLTYYRCDEAVNTAGTKPKPDDGKIYLRPTVCPVKSFDAANDAKELHNKLGDGVDGEKLKYILTNRSMQQLQDIQTKYAELYPREEKLTRQLNDKFSNQCENIIQRSVLVHEEVRAIDLYKALRAPINNVDADDVVNLVCTLTETQYKALDKMYKEKYELSVEQDIQDTSTDRRNWNKDLKHHIVNYCLNRCATLDKHIGNGCHRSMEGIICDLNKLEGDEFITELKKTLESCCDDQLQTIANLTNLVKKIKALKAGDFKFVADTVVFSRAEPFNYSVQVFFDAIDGSGTDNTMVIRNTILHSGSDLMNIKEAYKQLKDKDLKKEVADEFDEHSDCVKQFLEEFLRDQPEECYPESDPLDSNFANSTFTNITLIGNLPPPSTKTN